MRVFIELLSQLPLGSKLAIFEKGKHLVYGAARRGTAMAVAVTATSKSICAVAAELSFSTRESARNRTTLLLCDVFREQSYA